MVRSQYGSWCVHSTEAGVFTSMFTTRKPVRPFLLSSFISKMSIKLQFDKLRYKVTNTGVTNICKDILVCSYYFGQIKIDNKLLLPGDSVLSDKQVFDEKSIKNRRSVSPGTKCDKQRSCDNGNEERARAFVCDESIYSNEIIVHIGVAFISTADLTGVTPTDPTLYRYKFSVSTALESLIPAVNVRFTSLYNDNIKESTVSNPVVHNEKAKLWYDSEGIHGHITSLDPGEVISFTIDFRASVGLVPKIYKWSSKFITDSPVLDPASQDFSWIIPR